MNRSIFPRLFILFFQEVVFMKVCSVLESFLSATQGHLNKFKEEDSTDSSSSSGGAQYHDPGMAHGILAPDACFNYH